MICQISLGTLVSARNVIRYVTQNKHVCISYVKGISKRTDQAEPTSSLPLHANNEFTETAESTSSHDVHRQNIAGR